MGHAGVRRGVLVLVVTMLVVAVGPGAIPMAAAETPVAASSAGGSAAAPEVGYTDWSAISAGLYHTCGIRITRQLYCWGSSYYGQLGTGVAPGGEAYPTLVGTATNWASVSAGGFHTCAIKTNHRLFCWGRDGSEGRLGDGGGAADKSSPVRIGAAQDWASVSAGIGHTCARTTSRRLFCWGYGASGQLGNGVARNTQATPAQVAGRTTDWASVSVGDNHTCAIKTNHRLYCWGRDSEGQVGNGPGSSSNQPSPRRIGAASNWASATAGTFHTCATTTTHRLFCWGRDVEGQLGNGSPPDTETSPAEVHLAAIDWAAVDAGSLHTCARKINGQLYCWGEDTLGQSGTPGTPSETIPTEVSGGGVDWGTVSGGGTHTCARRTTGRLFCWGGNSNGELGFGTVTLSYPTPGEVG